MKNLLKCFSILLIIAGLSGTLTAQTPQYYNFNSGTTSDLAPFNTPGGMEMYTLFLAGDFSTPSAAPAGNITTIYIRIAASYPLGPWTYTNLTIAMGQSTVTTLPTSGFYTGSMTTVYSHASVSLTGAANTWMPITLDTPFPYDPTQSLILNIGQCSCPGASGWSWVVTGNATPRFNYSTINGGCPYNFQTYEEYLFATGIDIAASCTPPTVTSLAATAITTNGATLNGTVNANGCSTTVTFQYGLTTGYGSTVTATPSPVTGSTATAVSAAISGLTPCTLYHYRCVGVNSGGTIYGSDMTFTTTCGAPTVVTQAATLITANSATLNGTVNANNSNANTSFDYGLTIAYGTNLPGVPASVSGATPTAVSLAISGLLPNTLYHYRINGVNAFGTTNGSDMTFTTSQIPPTVVTQAATGVNLTVATLNGTVNANNLSTTVTFNWGLTVGYGSTISATPTTVTGTSTTSVLANLTGLTPSTTYHFRVSGVSSAGTSNGNDMTFTTVCNVAGPAGAITGPAQVCNNGTGYVYSVSPIANANSYSWTLPFGAIITAGNNTNTITVSYPNPSYSGNIYVYAIGCAGNGSSSSMAVNVNPNANPTITGPSTACQGNPGYVYTTQSGMSNYVWAVTGGLITAGGTSSSNTATVTWNTAGTENISVNYNNATGCPALQPTVYNVTVNALPTPIITGNASPCTALPITYSAQTGMTAYNWSVTSGGTITGGAGTSSITVVWNVTGGQNVSLTFTSPNGCSNAIPTVYAVTVKQGPTPTISGTNNLCVNSGYYTYTTQSGMTGYTWSISSGGVILYGSTTNVVTVNWVASGSQTISVNYTNSNGCAAPSPVSYSVTVNSLPGPAGTITGTAEVCAGTSGVAYSVPPIQNATNYVWTLPPGATIAGTVVSNSITVNFSANASSGNITVVGNNICGDGTVSPPFAVTVLPLPAPAGTITGPATVCQGDMGKVYKVPPISGATSYTWTLPTGATAVSGSNSDSITVNFSNSASSGDITVYGSNSCGNGTASPSFVVTVNPKPPTPVVTNTGTTLQSSAATGNQWYFQGAPIMGATGQTYVATQDGYYWDVVTLNGCPSDSSNHKLILTTGINPHSPAVISVYPVPNEGQFNVSITTASAEIFSIRVYNNLGIKIYEEAKVDVNGSLQKVIDLGPVPGGVYTIIFEDSQNQVVKKIVVNK
jgi:hypothetical protein